MTYRAKVKVALVATGLLIGIAALGLPALAFDGHDARDRDHPPQERVDRRADDGSVIPEPTTPPGGEPAINSRADLVALEKQFDPEGSPAKFMCASAGDHVVTVIDGHEAPPDAQVNPDAGPLLPDLADACAGRDWVVGR